MNMIEIEEFLTRQWNGNSCPGQPNLGDDFTTLDGIRKQVESIKSIDRDVGLVFYVVPRDNGWSMEKLMAEV